MIDEELEQRMNIKFCVRIRKSPSETLSMLRKVYGENTMTENSVFECHRQFMEELGFSHGDGGQEKAPVATESSQNHIYSADSSEEYIVDHPVLRTDVKVEDVKVEDEIDCKPYIEPIAMVTGEFQDVNSSHFDSTVNASSLENSSDIKSGICSPETELLHIKKEPTDD